MRIIELEVQNYKSLRHVRFEPCDLNVIVGANASGKTNFADSIDFLSEVYRHGLEVAVARKGGYENIAFRKMRRSKSPVSFTCTTEISADDVYTSRKNTTSQRAFRYRHSFAFVARGYSIRAEFQIVSESLEISMNNKAGDWETIVTLTRDDNNKISLEASEAFKKSKDSLLRTGPFYDLADINYVMERPQPLPPTELFISSVGRFTAVLWAWTQAITGVRVFQISPSKSREFGVPTPRPELGGEGDNLPAVVDLLRKSNKDEWKQVMQAMRHILPGLKNIIVDYTSSRTLGLSFEEENYGRPWSMGEVSDGTIHTLALLVAIFDSRYTALVLEEPENSVHPWIIRHIIDACRDASVRKQVIITTHSPIVMDAVKPEELWVMWRSDGESRLERVTQLESKFQKLWADGDVATFDLLDSGMIPQALPPILDE
jgi:predicted ATPase